MTQRQATMTTDRGDQAFLRTDLYGREHDMTYGGALSFMRRKYTRDLTGVDVAVTGIPFDCATSNRSGARLWGRGRYARHRPISPLSMRFRSASTPSTPWR